MHNNPFVFESPDKGSTIYVRTAGTINRTKIDKTDTFIEKYIEWTEILKAAENNPAIKIALEQLKTGYYLNKDYDSKT